MRMNILLLIFVVSLCSSLYTHELTKAKDRQRETLEDQLSAQM